jgi:predicted enzyme related to lactoylglutathione lyase
MSEKAAADEQMMMPKHGQVYWTEIAPTNLKACKSFYANLSGWKLKKSEAAGSVGSKDNCMAGGMYQMGKEYGNALRIG